MAAQWQQQRQAPASGAFVDAVTGRHAATSAAELLAKRRLTWDKHHGWTYDAWVDDPALYALAGANGRFSLPALARGLSTSLTQAAGVAAVAAAQHAPALAAVLGGWLGGGEAERQAAEAEVVTWAQDRPGQEWPGQQQRLAERRAGGGAPG